MGENIPIGALSREGLTCLLSPAKIGHTRIAARHNGNGCGKRQMREAVRRVIGQAARKIAVTTSENLVAAQHIYEASGFKFT